MLCIQYQASPAARPIGGRRSGMSVFPYNSLHWLSSHDLMISSLAGARRLSAASIV